MKSENSSKQEVNMSRLANLKTVTPFSKHLTVILFIILPFVGGYIGYMVGVGWLKEIDLSSGNHNTNKEIFSSQNITAELNQGGESLTVAFKNLYQYPETYAVG